ncbi:TPR and ankyrin repeat-containing protein 1 [Psilocybe cubensis]|uniref:TPR and ankyrin repeat-containing protein 1 n=1 Tax=Psilocybe cubensis TaxID=181762 RepID=A0ACB8HHU5_PSICU|nr:TPR and ankyrin repeat-containing protein 1 [Psilocybe cubensis]KAH9487237.1 TPR and ankyrin repeat-containing protein 1 [Psilocybe cubensis]
MLYKMLRIEREYQLCSEYCAKPRQVFITQSRVLAAKVEDLFASYLESLAIASNRSTKYRKSASDSEAKDESLEDNEDMELGGNLPRRFSELEDKHFPLFLTIDRLYSMIEADIEASEKEVKPESFQIISPVSRPLQPATAAKGKLVTYDRFLGEYWPHLNQSLRKNITPNLVFSEFMGVIQGSEYTVTSGCLDRKTYEELSVKTQPTFAEHRSVIYGLFEAYRKLKNERWDYDAPDRTHAIIRAITQRQGILGEIFDYVYVDETQDNLLVDALVLRLLSRNTDGLFWAGDTAQTISAGSSFRFKDLTSFMFKFEKQRLLLQNTSQLSLMDKSEKPNTPKQFHLAVNYRSHSGIVDCAHSVIELIMKHWPYSIDSLPRERGNTTGVKPIFYQDVYPGYIREGHFLSKGSNRNEKIELGANQCILVRDEAAKQRLEEELGKIGLVIRPVPMEASPQQHLKRGSKLKSLYVAITRARNNLRIADESLKGEPMRALWSNRGQIRNCHPDDDLSDFAVPSSKEEWARRALELSRNHKYSHARDSYEKAGNPRQAAVENARYLEQLALRIPSNTRKREREAAFKVAAGAFISCAESALKSHTKNSHYKSAAQCFEDAGDNLSAAKTYELIPDFTKASLLYRKLGRFDVVHSILVHHAEEVDNMESLRDIVRLYYVNKKEFDKTHQLFETVEDEIEYLEDRNLDMAQVDLYLMLGRRIDAVDIHLKEGRFLEAVDLIIEGVNLDSNTSQRAAHYILQGLWQNLSVGTSTTPESKQINELLKRFEVLDKGAIESADLLEFQMFQAISDREFDKLASLAKSLAASGNPDAAFLCLDYHYNILPSLDTMDIYQISASLQLFSEYICTLHNLAFCLDPSSDYRVMKLFGIIKVDNDFMVLSNNFLSRSSSLMSKSRGSESSSRYFSKSDLVSTYHTCTQRHLLDRVTRENDICRRSSALNPCLRHLVYLHFGGCNEVTCRLQSHISPDDAWRQSWLSAHLLQISIYNSISGIQYKSQMLRERRFWIGKLHEVLNPPHYLLASTYDTYCDIADAKAKWAIVNDWSRSISSEIGYQWPYTAFLTTVIQAADMAFTLNRTEASTFMFRSQIFISPDTPDVFLTNNAQNILKALIFSMDGKASSSLLMGISFIDHVVNLQIPVDINTFLSFIEDICSSLIICNQYCWRQNLSKVTLPRGWIVRALKKFDPVVAAQQDTRGKFWMLFRPLRAIIHGIHSGSANHFLCGDDMRKLTLQPPVVRNVFISRVYVNAENFGGIILATRRSLRGSTFDEMIRIMHSTDVQYPIYELEDLRRVVYTNIGELLEILDPRSGPRSLPADNSSTFLGIKDPIALDVGPLSDTREMEGGIPTDTQEDGTLDETASESADDLDSDLQHQEEIPQIEIPEDLQVGYSDREYSAISIIKQKFTRIVLSRKRLLKGSGLVSTIYKWASLSKPMARQIPLLQYRLRYLAFVPAILGCLEEVNTLVMTKKAELKLRFKHGTLRHQEMDDISANLTRITVVVKAIKKHQEILRPQSELHARQDIGDLKKHVQSGLDLLSDLQLPFHLPDEIRNELHMIYKGLLQEPRPCLQTKKIPKKPSLNVDDIYYPIGQHICEWEDEWLDL